MIEQKSVHIFHLVSEISQEQKIFVFESAAILDQRWNSLFKFSWLYSYRNYRTMYVVIRSNYIAVLKTNQHTWTFWKMLHCERAPFRQWQFMHNSPHMAKKNLTKRTLWARVNCQIIQTICLKQNFVWLRLRQIFSIPPFTRIRCLSISKQSIVCQNE